MSAAVEIWFKPGVTTAEARKSLESWPDATLFDSGEQVCATLPNVQSGKSAMGFTHLTGGDGRAAKLGRHTIEEAQILFKD